MDPAPLQGGGGEGEEPSALEEELEEEGEEEGGEDEEQKPEAPKPQDTTKGETAD